MNDDVKSWFIDASLGGTSVAVDVRMDRDSIPFRVGSTVAQIASGVLLTAFLAAHRRFAPTEPDPDALKLVDLDDYRRHGA